MKFYSFFAKGSEAEEKDNGVAASRDYPTTFYLITLELQGWIEEMSAFVKLIDKNHLVTIGLEGFYGPNDPKGSTVNPEYWASRLGSDFIRNSKTSNIDFTSVHIYPDHW